MTANKYTKEYVANKEAALVSRFGKEVMAASDKQVSSVVENLKKQKAD